MFQRNVDTLIQTSDFKWKDQSPSHGSWITVILSLSAYYYLIIIIKVYKKYHWAKWMPEYIDTKALTWSAVSLEVTLVESKGTEV
jgi:hypothetical protein